MPITWESPGETWKKIRRQVSKLQVHGQVACSGINSVKEFARKISDDKSSDILCGPDVTSITSLLVAIDNISGEVLRRIDEVKFD